MAKKTNPVPIAENSQTAYLHNRGTIQDNAVKALLRTPLFRSRIEKKLKGKGSYQRKAKHAGRYFEKPDDKSFGYKSFIIGFLLGSAYLL